MVVNFYQFIQEEYSRANLYHALEIDRAKTALETNKLDCYSFQRIWPGWKRLKDDHPDYFKSQFLRGISLTRDFDYAKKWNSVVFEFDQEKLRSKWKITPYNWGYSIGRGYRQGIRAKREREEFLVTGLTDRDPKGKDFRGLGNESPLTKPVGSIYPLDKYLVGFWVNEYLKEDSKIQQMVKNPLFLGFFKK